MQNTPKQEKRRVGKGMNICDWCDRRRRCVLTYLWSGAVLALCLSWRLAWVRQKLYVSSRSEINCLKILDLETVMHLERNTDNNQSERLHTCSCFCCVLGSHWTGCVFVLGTTIMDLTMETGKLRWDYPPFVLSFLTPRKQHKKCETKIKGINKKSTCFKKK